MSTLVNSSSSSSIDGFFQKCIQNMYTQIKEHHLTEEFLNLFRNDGNLKRGVIFCDAPVILKIIDITQDDGHSGASFACCCHKVYAKFRQEEKQPPKPLAFSIHLYVKWIVCLSSETCHLFTVLYTSKPWLVSGLVISGNLVKSLIVRLA